MLLNPKKSIVPIKLTWKTHGSSCSLSGMYSQSLAQRTEEWRAQRLRKADIAVKIISTLKNRMCCSCQTVAAHTSVIVNTYDAQRGNWTCTMVGFNPIPKGRRDRVPHCVTNCVLRAEVAMVPPFKSRNNVQRNSTPISPFFLSLSFSFLSNLRLQTPKWTGAPGHFHNGAVKCDPVWMDWQRGNAENAPLTNKKKKEQANGCVLIKLTSKQFAKRVAGLLCIKTPPVFGMGICSFEKGEWLRSSEIDKRTKSNVIPLWDAHYLMCRTIWIRITLNIKDNPAANPLFDCFNCFTNISRAITLTYNCPEVAKKQGNCAAPCQRKFHLCSAVKRRMEEVWRSWPNTVHSDDCDLTLEE